MTAGPITFKRWIATLCVALMAFAAFGHLESASAHAFCNDATYSAGDTSGTGEDGQTLPRTSHHCCCAHPTNAPSVALTGAVNSAGDLLAAPLSDQFVPSGAPDGLERPPRTTAIA